MYKKERDRIFCILSKTLSSTWDGRESIRYMKENGCKNWRQMEWPGFYFQFMCEILFSENGFMEIPGPTYGNVEFDGFRIIPWDFKAHSIDPEKPDDGKIPTNGYNESVEAILHYGTIGFIIITGDSNYDDEKQTFKKWHDQLKGGTSSYELERINRKAPSRRRKVSFKPKGLIFVFVDDSNIESCEKFQNNFRNSNGVPRSPKILLDLKKNKDLKIFRYHF